MGIAGHAKCGRGRAGTCIHRARQCDFVLAVSKLSCFRPKQLNFEAEPQPRCMPLRLKPCAHSPKFSDLSGSSRRAGKITNLAGSDPHFAWRAVKMREMAARGASRRSRSLRSHQASPTPPVMTWLAVMTWQSHSYFMVYTYLLVHTSS
jgi:hypothetical protein